MLSLGGYVVVIASVLLGYILHHGELGILFQPTELIIIGGAALGALIASSSVHLLKGIVHASKEAFFGNGISHDKYMELLLCMNDLFKLAAQNPLSLEKHVENPAESEIFKKYPKVNADEKVMHFLCNTLTLLTFENISYHDLDDLLEQDIESNDKEERQIPATLARIADAFPGLGIVAAVLGVVITMGKLSQGKEVIGASVAAALVGTFLGVLFCYGIFQPLASRVEASLEEKSEILHVIKAGLVAYSRGARPVVSLEYIRRNIPPEYRPTFKELEEATKGGGATGGKA